MKSQAQSQKDGNLQATQVGCLRCGRKQKIWSKKHLPSKANGDVLGFCSRKCKEKTNMKVVTSP